MSLQLFKKPKDVSYTDMCIWIDNNFYEPNCDYNKAYTYMYLIAYMLACKQKYFSSKEDYEEFASMLAYSTYQRMINEEKGRVKSVLNYMKSVLYFRKATYEAQRHQEVINPEFDDWDSVLYAEKCRLAFEASNRDRLILGVYDTLKDVPYYIKKNIPKIYKGNRVLYKNIYISCLLSMLNRFTLPKVYEDQLKSKLKSTTNFDEVKFYKKHSDNDIILWHLDESMSVVITVILNKVNNYLVEEIRGLSNDILLSDDEFNSIFSSAFIVGGDNETID